MKISQIFSSRNITILIFLLFATLSFIKFKPSLISWDTLAHYLYLPATFIYDDPGIKNHDQMYQIIVDEYQLSSTFYQVVRHENGNHIIKTTSGLSILHSPFFFGAHLVALAGPAQADGFSSPYQFAMLLSSLFFMITGLIYVRKIIRHLYNDHTATLTLIILVFGTNLFATYYMLTSIHLYLFGLYAFFIWQTIRWHEDPSKGTAFMIGLSAGFITLLRPTDAICVLIPVIWGIFDLPSFRKKFILLSTHFGHVMLFVAGGLVTLLPQIMYWKIFTGSFLFYSYATPGEGLEFFTPFIREVLFSFRKGWFIYTPVMLFAFGGFITLYHYTKHIFYAVLIFTLLNIYLIATWSCWWYADSFGHRAFVHSYALLSIPLASLIYNLLLKKRMLTFLVFLSFFFLILLNLFQTRQYARGIIHPSRMTKDYYFAVFGQIKAVEDEKRQLLLVERSDFTENNFANPERYVLKLLLATDFQKNPDIPDSQKITDSIGFTGVRLDAENIYTPAFRRSYWDMTTADHLYFIIRSRIFLTEDPLANPLSLVVHFTHEGGPYHYRAYDTEKHASTLKTNEWNDIEMVYLSPEVRKPGDELSFYFWFRGSHDVLVDNIFVEVWEPVRGW
jgi:hypothetical protein